MNATTPNPLTQQVLDWPESTLSEHVRQACKRLKLHAYHTYRSVRSSPGFPDWVIVGPGGIIFRELKTIKGKATPAQQKWLLALINANQDAGIWTPADWPHTILGELRILSQPPKDPPWNTPMPGYPPSAPTLPPSPTPGTKT